MYKLKKLIRFITIYGMSRTLFKVFGRLRISVFRLPSFKKRNIGLVGCGQFTYAMNSINEPSTHYIGIIRTGGFFREPSWYAYFAFLALYISFYFRNYKTLGIISLGLIISTSSAGIGLLFLFKEYMQNFVNQVNEAKKFFDTELKKIGYIVMGDGVNFSMIKFDFSIKKEFIKYFELKNKEKKND